MRNKCIFLFLILMLVSTPVFAFLYEIPVLEREQIQKLSDKDLEEAYIDARIEQKTSQEFHNAAGFNSAKDYNKRKALLRYIFELRREIGHREGFKDENLDDYLD